ncbi:MAG: toprim domain-containing protein [Acidimicrobiia bacterium]|nr:toprim domain-containing protein [Acidimicrobiia bacterium]
MESTRTTDRSDVVDYLHDQLRDSLAELVTSDDWQRALAVAARFHDYSFSNTRLIWAQSLARGFTPRRVAGYRAWQGLGRQVRKGEKGLQILAPVVRKVAAEDGEEKEEERRVVGYRVVHVFDIAQTDGEPLPEVTAALVDGELPADWNHVTNLITEAGFGFQVADDQRLGEANGITDWRHRDVVVRASLPGAQRFKTAVHELAHVRLHEPESGDRPACRGIVEVEAESVAYVVCAALGIDSAGYSLPYVASWSGGDVTKVTATANRVIGCARTVFTEIEHHRELQLDPASNESLVQTQPSPAVELPPSSELMEVLEAAVTFYRHQLENDSRERALRFLHSRGIGEEATSVWHLGWAPDSWRALTTALLDQGFSEDILIEAGVAGRARTGRLYDRMRNRVVFPVFDPSGRPRGFAGRLLEGEGPKYLNTPETELYRKRSLLYGLHLAQEPIREIGNAIVVEGYLDVIAAHQAGFTNAIATAGTALTSEHLHQLGQIAGKVTLAFDGDNAGLRAVERVAELDLAGRQLRMSVVRLPPERDPADLLIDNTRSFQQALAGAIPIEHHLIEQIVGAHNLKEPEATARAIRQASSVIARVTEPRDRAQATEHLARTTGRDPAIIEMALAQARSARCRHPVREIGIG